MYTVIRRYKTDPANTDEIVRKVQDTFLPIITKVPGFISYYTLDGGNGDLTTVSIFCDREGSQRSIRAAADFVRDNLARLLPNPPQVTEGEVRVHQQESERVPC